MASTMSYAGSKDPQKLTYIEFRNGRECTILDHLDVARWQRKAIRVQQL